MFSKGKPPCAQSFPLPVFRFFGRFRTWSSPNDLGEEERSSAWLELVAFVTVIARIDGEGCGCKPCNGYVGNVGGGCSKVRVSIFLRYSPLFPLGLLHLHPSSSIPIDDTSHSLLIFCRSVTSRRPMITTTMGVDGTDVRHPHRRIASRSGR